MKMKIDDTETCQYKMKHTTIDMNSTMYANIHTCIHTPIHVQAHSAIDVHRLKLEQ